MRLLSAPVACLAMLATACATTEQAAAPRWTLTETLRLGGAESGPLSFDWVKSIAVDTAGRIFVYNHDTQEIRMFGQDGELLRVIGRKGSGPGEFRNAEGVTVTHDGKLWVRDAANGRFSIFSGDGDFEQAIAGRFCYSQQSWTPLSDSAGRIIDMECVPQAGQEELRRVVLAYRTDLSGVDTLFDMPACGSRELVEAATWITRTPTSVSYQRIPFAATTVRALGGNGELWCAPNSSIYEILRIGGGGMDTTRIARMVEALPVTVSERDSVIAIFEAKGPSGLDFGRIPEVKSIIERLTVDEQGRLWVRRTDAQGAIQFDVFDGDGEFLATAAMGVYDSSIYQPFVVRGDDVYTIVLDEMGIPFVVRFRITEE